MKKKILISLFLTIIVFSLTGCNKENKTLKAIYEKLIVSESYKSYKEYSTITENIKGNVLSISIKNDTIDNTYDFKLDGDYLTLEVNKDDMYGAVLLLELADAIANNYGMDTEMMSAYINGVTADNLESKYVKFKETDNKLTYSIYATGKFDMSLLNEMNIKESDLEIYGDKPEGNGSGYGVKGNYIYYVSYSDEKYDDFILAERNGFSDNAYNNLLTLVKHFFEKDYNDFTKNYPKLEAKTFGKFKVTMLDSKSEEVTEKFSSINVENFKFVKVIHK